MQDMLLDYLLGCLDRKQTQALEQTLAEDEEAVRQIDILRLALDPLRYVPEPPAPPAGLAVQTCERVFALRVSHHGP